MNIFADLAKWLLSFRREKVLDRRDRTRVLADELDKLADLMSDVLAVTESNGTIQVDKLPDLERLRRRVWNRWVSILGESGRATNDSELQTEIEKAVRVAHAAPGAYVEEIYLAQVALADGLVPHHVRKRFAESIDRIRDLTTRMRLDV